MTWEIWIVGVGYDVKIDRLTREQSILNSIEYLVAKQLPWMPEIFSLKGGEKQFTSQNKNKNLSGAQGTKQLMLRRFGRC